MDPTAYLDALMSLPGMWNPLISRNGHWVAWTWFRTGPAADVYAVPTDGSIPPIRLTETTDNTYLVSWTPDSRSVIVEQDKDGNERAQLFRVNLDQPLEMIPLTEPEPNYYVRGGNLHPNGRWLIYGANFDVETGAEIAPTWMYRHNLETGERFVLARPEKGGYTWPDLSSTGDYVLYRRNDLHPAGRQIWLVDIEGSEDREILNFGAEVKTFASWFPDGNRILVRAETETHTRIGVWTVSSGELYWLLDDPERNVEQAYIPFGSDKIVVVEVDRARSRSSLMDPETGAEVPVPEVVGNLVPLAPVGDDRWVARYYSSRQPEDIAVFSFGDPHPDHWMSLSRIWERTPLEAGDLAPAEEYSWQSSDGLEIHGWLYHPEGPAKGTIVYVHGGPTAHSEDEINTQIQFFVRQGFTVLDPNYRGSTGYGLAFREMIKEDGWGGREQDDIRTGIEALLREGIAEPGKVGITGTSYGGYSAWCAITRFPQSTTSAAAPVCGMTDLVVDYETTRPDVRPYSEEMMGGSPEQVPNKYYRHSPIHFVENIQGNLLIIQGLQDPNVTPENVRTVEKALHKAGIPYQLLTFDDEGHGISKPRNQRKLYLHLAEFFVQSFSE